MKDDFKRIQHDGRRWYTPKGECDSDWHPSKSQETRTRMKREIQTRLSLAPPSHT